MQEEWKDIQGYEGIYQVSNLGRIKGLRKRNNAYNNYYKKEFIMKQQKTSKGYMRIQLNNDFIKRKTFAVHRLVSKAFIPNPDNLPQVNHINGIKNDNRVCNLEWCSSKENQIHAINTGLKKTKLGKYIPRKPKLAEEERKKIQIETLNKYRNIGVQKSIINNSKKIAQYDDKGRILKTWDSIRGMCRETGYSRSGIIKVCKGKNKSAYGYIWRYVNER